MAVVHSFWSLCNEYFGISIIGRFFPIWTNFCAKTTRSIKHSISTIRTICYHQIWLLAITGRKEEFVADIYLDYQHNKQKIEFWMHQCIKCWNFFWRRFGISFNIICILPSNGNNQILWRLYRSFSHWYSVRLHPLQIERSSK